MEADDREGGNGAAGDDAGDSGGADVRRETEGGAGGSEASADGQAGEIEQVDLPGSAGVQIILQLACFSYLAIDLAGGGVDLEGGGVDGEEELLPGGEQLPAIFFGGGTELGSAC